MMYIYIYNKHIKCVCIYIYIIHSHILLPFLFLIHIRMRGFPGHNRGARGDPCEMGCDLAMGEPPGHTWLC